MFFPALCVVLLTFSNPLALHADEALPFNYQLKKQIRDIFFKDGLICAKKISSYRRKIEKRYREISGSLSNYYTLKEGLPKKEALKKISRKSEVKAYRILLEYIKELEASTGTAFKLQAAEILDLDNALKSSGQRLTSSYLLRRAATYYLQDWKIPLDDTPEGEAVNLVNPVSGRLLNHRELQRSKEKGLDISKFNPAPDSPFWTAQNIEEIDLAHFYRTGQDALHRGLGIFFPTGKGYFRAVRQPRAKPGIDIYVTKNGKQHDFKLTVGAEVHAESTCAALFSVLGFSVDISEYVRDFKLVLGEITPHEFRRKWNAHYSNRELNRYIEKTGRDHEGHYIIFHQGLLEAQPPELIRVGPWAYGENGHSGRREVRGMALFNIWVSNPDLNDNENNRLILRKFGDRYRFFYAQHNMGLAFGKVFPGRPGDFSWHIIKGGVATPPYKSTLNDREKEKEVSASSLNKSFCGGAGGSFFKKRPLLAEGKKKQIRLNYRSFQKSAALKALTFADAKWMTRLIARLSRKQIAAAVDLGGWPPSTRGLLVEKLIARRNQLVQVFGLSGEATPGGKKIALLAFNRRVSAADKAVVNGKLKKYRFPGYPQFYGPRIRELVPIVLRAMRDLFIDGLVKGVSAIKYLDIKPAWLGLDPAIISKIVPRISRVIVENPYPEGEDDDFLVMDSVEIGFLLGYGVVLWGDVSFTQKYTLVYPVRTREEGRFHNNFILNFALPSRVKGARLPENYTVLMENYFSLRGRLWLWRHQYLLGNTLDFSKINLQRKFVSRRGNRLVYFEDKGDYDRLAYRLFLELLYIFRFRYTFFDTSYSSGTLLREYVELDFPTGAEEEDKKKMQALKQAIIKGDASLLKSLGTKKIIKDKFKEKKSKFNFFGLLRSRSIFRFDNLREKAPPGKENNGIINYYQIENQEQASWRFFDNGEKHFSSVRFTGMVGQEASPHRKKNKIKQKFLRGCRGQFFQKAPPARRRQENKNTESMLEISLRIDDRNTKDSELKNSYLNFINSIAGKKDFLDFDSSAHSRNKLWGYMNVSLNIVLYKEAIAALLNFEGKKTWDLLARKTGKSAAYWKSLSKPRFYRGRKIYRGNRGDRYLAQRTAFFIAKLKKAQREHVIAKQMSYLVKAVRETIYKSGHGFKPALQAVLLEIAGRGNFFIKARVTMPLNKELELPTGTPLYNEMGKKRRVNLAFFPFVFEDPEEIYHAAHPWIE